ncbi:unnamed protein product [Brugia timori]|uniref:Uncharacterized protein n=1 Tax=Brugia timori TaxID=42155 RepID=A0A3P7TQ55_9BILA|nr:unnamed protein product [Brugia timori]
MSEILAPGGFFYVVALHSNDIIFSSAVHCIAAVQIQILSGSTGIQNAPVIRFNIFSSVKFRNGVGFNFGW